jgi:hypothetical protein
MKIKASVISTKSSASWTFHFEGADLIILAGDINLGTKGIEWIKATITDIPVINVLGNDEYYKGSHPKT